MSSPEQAPSGYGATVARGGVWFRCHAPDATSLKLCLFNGDRETALPMTRIGGDFVLFVEGIGEGARYGCRADGPWQPDAGHLFDPDKLLVDPWATRIDSRYRWDPALALPRYEATDTAPLVPKAIVENLAELPVQKPHFERGGLIYEINVRGFTKCHPDIAVEQRGTIAALAHPSIIRHLKKIGVSAIELMPITAWIDERHLAQIGLSNAWGYNPVTFMTLDPMLAPGGMAELASTVKTLHTNGIGVILDLVFNHTGESDVHGATLSLRGLLNRRAYRHYDEGDRLVLANDAGTGNTVACDRTAMRNLILASLRHFVSHAGVDGFRFDLAPILGRTAHGFHPDAETLRAIEGDPLLSDRILIAEPWDIGPGGYQLGRFSDNWLEWNDRFRDDMRMYWRGDAHKQPDFAHVFAGSSNIFGGHETRSVNFLAAHDGFTLMDLVSHEQRHNGANGEENRDGHSDNHSWNNGHEGATDNAAILAARRADVMSMLTSLYLSRGTIMLTAGDEFGRSQNGNNNAYAQDNEITWIDWNSRDSEIEDHSANLASLRGRYPALSDQHFFTGHLGRDTGTRDIVWLRADGMEMVGDDWHSQEAPTLQIIMATGDAAEPRLAMLVNRSHAEENFVLPETGLAWRCFEGGKPGRTAKGLAHVPPRSVQLYVEKS